MTPLNVLRFILLMCSTASIFGQVSRIPKIPKNVAQINSQLRNQSEKGLTFMFPEDVETVYFGKECRRRACKRKYLSYVPMAVSCYSKNPASVQRACLKINNVNYVSTWTVLYEPMNGFDIIMRGNRKNFVFVICSVFAYAKSPTTISPSLPTGPIPSLSPQNEDCVCGKVNRVPRIVGGEDTEQHEYPWQVGLVNVTYHRNSNHHTNQMLVGNPPFCGGSIISSMWIVTAAHCIDDQNIFSFVVIFGDHDWTVAENLEQYIPVAQIIIHPLYFYNSSHIDNDIGLVKVASPIVFPISNEIAPICLSSSDLPPPGSPVIVTGWGLLYEKGSQPDILQEVVVNMISYADCSFIYNNTTPNMFCAGVMEGGKDACKFDSGGPLIAEDDEPGDHYNLWGIVSWGKGCARKRNPGVYTNVRNYIDWIVNTTNLDTCPPPPVMITDLPMAK